MNARAHGDGLRGESDVSQSPISDGRFGRMFRRLGRAPRYTPGELDILAESMREMPADPAQPQGWNSAGAPPATGDNDQIAAGYTYFGQFVDHDITFDPVSQLTRDNDPGALSNFRTPRLDLDSVYGSGPADEPFQYDRENPGKLLIAANANGELDLPRNDQGIALVGDPRNDENIIVSQLQLAFLELHNKIHDEIVVPSAVEEGKRLAATQRLVRWHYQWVVVHDFLDKIIGAEMRGKVLEVDADTGAEHADLQYYKPQGRPYMPVEFSGAAYRFGHSQVRPAYNLNANVRDRPIFAPGDAVGELDDLRGRRELPAAWSVHWPDFLGIDGSAPQPSRLIDAKLNAGLFDLPGLGADEPQSLALRNLLRGQALKLPSGQAVARHLGYPVLDGAALGGVLEPTPLWFYILKEAELQTGGRHLGLVGGRIVAEVIIGLLEGDKQSYLQIEPTWRPIAPIASADGQLTLPDLIKYATT